MRLIQCNNKDRIRKIERKCFPDDALCALDECLSEVGVGVEKFINNPKGYP